MVVDVSRYLAPFYNSQKAHLIFMSFPLFRLVYISRGVRKFEPPELLSFLKSFRAANAEHDITGILLYLNGDFMQLLEGTEKEVMTLLGNIEKDSRHDAVSVVMRESIRERNFTNWFMAFRDLATPSWTTIPGYSEFLNMPFHAIPFWQSPNRCQELMLIFRAELS